ncbi:MAG: hypothetical protein P4M15_11570 [Alphaproteobacteria bacterium]|nr:hypothetical protein [Alphaproteobacteria bacterium]
MTQQKKTPKYPTLLKKWKSKEWKKALGEPIPFPQKDSGDGVDPFEYWLNHARKKLPDLYAAYGFDITKSDPLDDLIMLMYFAAQVVPGLQLGNRPGKPKKWEYNKAFTLIRDVQSVMKRSKASPMSASKWLHKNNPAYKKLAAVTIETRYRKTLKGMSPLAKLSLLHDESDFSLFANAPSLTSGMSGLFGVADDTANKTK